MATKKAAEIVADIKAHIQQQAGQRRAWYVGITSDIDQRLHVDHNVPKQNHWFIWRQAISEDDARAAEATLIDWGCSGGPGGGDDSCCFVYAYLIGPNTVE